MIPILSQLHADTLRLFCEKIKEEYASASTNDESTTATFHRPYHAAHMVHAVHSILVNTCLEVSGRGWRYRQVSVFVFFSGASCY